MEMGKENRIALRTESGLGLRIQIVCAGVLIYNTSQQIRIDVQLCVVFFCTVQVTEGLVGLEQRSPVLSVTSPGVAGGIAETGQALTAMGREGEYDDGSLLERTENREERTKEGRKDRSKITRGERTGKEKRDLERTSGWWQRGTTQTLWEPRAVHKEIGCVCLSKSCHRDLLGL